MQPLASVCQFVQLYCIEKLALIRKLQWLICTEIPIMYIFTQVDKCMRYKQSDSYTYNIYLKYAGGWVRLKLTREEKNLKNVGPYEEKN